MLKVEYPCRENLLSIANPIKPVITWNEAKKHLHDVRLRRQKQFELNKNECERLCHLHKQAFTRQLESNSVEKPSNYKSIKYVTNKSSLLTKNHYSTPRMEHASIIYRQALPTFEIDTSIKSEDETSSIRELLANLTESSSTSSSCSTKKYFKHID